MNTPTLNALQKFLSGYDFGKEWGDSVYPLVEESFHELDILKIALDDAEKVIRGFEQHEDYIGRKTLMTVAEEWLKKYSDEEV